LTLRAPMLCPQASTMPRPTSRPDAVRRLQGAWPAACLALLLTMMMLWPWAALAQDAEDVDSPGAQLANQPAETEAASEFLSESVVPEGDPAAPASSSAAAQPAGQALGSSWGLSLVDHEHMPARFLVVDKEHQTFFVMERHSPLQKAWELPCATGQASGDKHREGDLRTPEGVYFIQRTLSKGLDYQLYGDIAYTLNFPNPIDRIKGKTGYGIWIHGRGTPLVPMDTRGCISLNNSDLHELGAILGRGTPVVIAHNVDWPVGSPDQAPEAMALAALVREWAKAWQQRSDTFFSFYDPEKYSRSGQSFRTFKANKERLFARLPWIHIMLADLTALPGPDYWITSFDQLYRAPGITSKVHKRLYWQKDHKDVWRIVGQELVQTQADLEQRYLSQVSPQVNEVVSLWLAAWERADLEGYASFYLPGARQQGRRGHRAIVEHKRILWTKNQPRSIEATDRRLSLHPGGVEVTFVQAYEGENGYKDNGIKTLVLEPRGDRWLISAEHWRKGN